MSGYITESLTEVPSEAEKIPVEGPGSLLRKAREAAGLTRVEVAARLHLRVSIIEAIEEDDYKKIPRLVFAKGYLRTYARFLGLSGDEIVERFNLLGCSEVKSEHLFQSGQKSRLPREGWSAGARLSLLGVIVLFIGFGIWHYSDPAGYFKNHITEKVAGVLHQPQDQQVIEQDNSSNTIESEPVPRSVKKAPEPLDVSPASATPLDELKSVSVPNNVSQLGGE